MFSQFSLELHFLSDQYLIFEANFLTYLSILGYFMLNFSEFYV